MSNLSCKYAGLELKSPVIAGSSAITHNVKNIIELEKQGVGAVVLKSLFEEEILGEHNKILSNTSSVTTDFENLDYLDYRIKEDNLKNYVQIIQQAKNQTEIPIIASINCISPSEWLYFAQEAERAGADALEINLFVQASSGETENNIEEKYIKILEKAVKTVKIPVIAKISYYFADLGGIIQRLSQTGIAGMVMFNRFFMPDIDINTERIVSDNVFSDSKEMGLSLRWVALMANRIECDIAASTGIHNGRDAVKQILAGADAVQIVSALYAHGAEAVKYINEGIAQFMKQKGYESINDFKGKLSYGKNVNAGLFERVQFMKYFSNKNNERVL